MKRTVLMLLVLLCIHSAPAQNVSNSMAKKAAESFWAKTLKNTNTTADLHYFLTKNADTLLYVYNIGSDGFVIVSGDYSCDPVLGYSTEGSFNNEMAPSCQAWLKSYSGQIAARKQTTSKNISPEWARLLSGNTQSLDKTTVKSVLPLITTKWDQGKFYNYKCPAYPGGPDGKCVTGCVATAMAQIMKYYNYPDQGVGAHSYSHPYFGTISADFTATTYDWANMGTYANNVNKEAIGTLIFHCGVSVDMDFTPIESGAQTENAALALKNYFHYRSTIAVVNKADLTSFDWIALLKDNLDEQHPVMYSGSGTGGGHAWVCDGYDDHNKFHMNWGWSGSDNGYFQVDTLVAGSYDFSLYQKVVVNIIPYFAPYCLMGRTYTDSTRVISDGSGYSYYWNDTDCDWLIKPDGAEKVMLQFSDFSTESANDVVSVYDGETTAGTLLGTFSGTDNPPVLTANSGKMLITFASNSATQGQGWTAKYWSLKQGDGIEEDDYGKVSVYPNPAMSEITIENRISMNEPCDISLYDISGKLVYSDTQALKSSNTISIDVSKLDTGFYFVALQSDHHNFRTKFVKQ